MVGLFLAGLGWRKGVWSVTLTFAKGDDVDRGRHRSIHTKMPSTVLTRPSANARYWPGYRPISQYRHLNALLFLNKALFSGHWHWDWHRHTFIESLISATPLLGYDTEIRSGSYGQARYPYQLEQGSSR